MRRCMEPCAFEHFIQLLCYSIVLLIPLAARANHTISMFDIGYRGLHLHQSEFHDKTGNWNKSEQRSFVIIYDFCTDFHNNFSLWAWMLVEYATTVIDSKSYSLFVISLLSLKAPLATFERILGITLHWLFVVISLCYRAQRLRTNFHQYLNLNHLHI